MASPEDGKKYILLETNDKIQFKVDEAAALLSVLISDMIQDDCAKSAIPLPNVDGTTFTLVEGYLNKHVEMEKKKSQVVGAGGKSAVDEEIKAWDAEFMRKADAGTLYHLLLAANYLEITSLLNLAVETTANRMKGKMPEEIRQIFGIPNDFTEKEEAKIREENMWAFQ